MSKGIETLPEVKEKALKELFYLLPEIKERLKTYGRNSHIGSVSEQVWVKFEKVVNKLERLGLVEKMTPDFKAHVEKIREMAKKLIGDPNLLIKGSYQHGLHKTIDRLLRVIERQEEALEEIADASWTSRCWECGGGEDQHNFAVQARADVMAILRSEEI